MEWIPAALCLEGGAFRGVYTSGVLDVLAEQGMQFACVAGVSAGALNGLNYVSGQVGRSARINFGYAGDPRYVGAKALLHNRGVIGFDFLFGELSHKVDPFDYEAFARSPQRFVAVATNCLTGGPAYFEKGGNQDIFTACIASASMPLASAKVRISGVPYLDGGVSVSVPLGWALNQRYSKIVLVLTRQKGFCKKEGDPRMEQLYRVRYRGYPKFVNALCNMDHRYNQLMRNIDQLEDEGRIFVIRPAAPITVARLERDVEKLNLLYTQGRSEAAAALPALREYLARPAGPALQ